MITAMEKQKLTTIIQAIEAAGYNPIDQLTGYIKTGNDAYITRQCGARALVAALDKDLIKAYLAAHG